MNALPTVQRMQTPRPGMPPFYYAGRPELLRHDYTGILLPEKAGQQLAEYAVRVGRQFREAHRPIVAPAGLPSGDALLQAAVSADNPAISVSRNPLSEAINEPFYAECITAGNLLMISEAPPDQMPEAHTVPAAIRALAHRVLALRNGTVPGWHLDDPGLPQAESNPREYRTDRCATLRRDSDAYGRFSNSHTAYPLLVAGLHIRTAEHLYEACRFPTYPKVQQAILDEPNPMRAKRIARRHIGLTRPDWRQVNIQLMDWCLGLKVAQHYDRMTGLFAQTSDLPIVQSSERDDFWGAVPRGAPALVGHNILGRLLERLRDRTEPPSPTRPAPVSGVILLGRPVNAAPCRMAANRQSTPQAG